MKKARRSLPLLAYRAEEALRKAVAEAIAEHRRNGVPIAIWRNGKVIRIPADQIEVREPQIECTVSPKKRK
ncbi:MAG: hypothetical protein COS40_14340 [Deltaproteobacteria bacterium CG03_land_8_20_14_0_80_45_14]|jgi:hypothetical protein|nr:MAG: hypothetical protein COS40_14340 [Deltaproteobacteria bacterium CG03_land_8_20_14_0_80_45_14]